MVDKLLVVFLGFNGTDNSVREYCMVETRELLPKLKPEQKRSFNKRERKISMKQISSITLQSAKCLMHQRVATQFGINDDSRQTREEIEIVP